MQDENVCPPALLHLTSDIKYKVALVILLGNCMEYAFYHIR